MEAAVPNGHDRWEGGVDVRLDGIEEELRTMRDEFKTHRHLLANRMSAIELRAAEARGFISGSKAALLLVGSLIGSAVGALVTWFFKH